MTMIASTMTRVAAILLTIVLLVGSHSVVAEETCTAEGVCTNNDAKSDNDCVDTHDQCGYWSTLGECDNNPTYMYESCPKACNLCGMTPGQRRKKVAKLKEEKEEPADVTETPYGVAQDLSPGTKHEAGLEKIVANVTNYMEEIVFKDPAYAKVKAECKNRCVSLNGID